MRILVEQSGYPLSNIGDIAMLQVAVTRLNSFWPDAVIEVFTTVPDKLAKFCPDACPLLPLGQGIEMNPVSKVLDQFMPSSMLQALKNIEYQIISHILKFAIDLKWKARQIETKNFKSFVEAIEAADLVVASGGGYITDAFEKKATITLSILDLANRLGKPTVMLGHGLGPLQNPKLCTQAKGVLPYVDIITLREQRAGIPLVNSLGISNKNFVVTGDDAIELVYEHRSVELGNGIGINLRFAEYAQVDTNLVKIISLALQDTARTKNAPLIPVPISHSKSDSKTIQQILAGYDDASDGGQNLDTPLKVIKQVGRCRVVVTGSYHAGVFALAQGIPIVALAKSEYYIDKFLGLAEQFRIGCEVILMSDKELRENLIVAIDNAWKSSEEVKPRLLESAKKQIELGSIAYQQVYQLIESRKNNQLKYLTN